MKNYTLKQKLKAKYIIILEINGSSYPSSYRKVIKDLQENTDLGELKISDAMQILNFAANEYKNLDFIYDIFASTEEEVKQIKTELKNYINKNTLNNEL
tara:strand:- start:2581 stop:2877 length:297 start_codon:yes stop_codon:yes gene_type:complete